MPFGLRQPHRATEFSNSRKWLVILLLVALCVLVLSLWQGASYLTNIKARQQLEQHAIASELENLKQRAREKLSANILAFAVATESPTWHKFAQNPAAQLEDLQQLLHSLIRLSPDVYQAQVLAANGHELLRLDKINGNPVIHPQANLPPTPASAFTRDALQFQQPGFYISDLNLATAQGAVTNPWQPSLQVTKPVFNQQQALTAIAVISIDANAIFEAYANADLTPKEQLYLLNPNGYWIYGKPETQQWGFMFNRRDSLPELQPELWQQLQQDDGVGQYRHTQFTARAVTVAELLPKGLPAQNSARVLWYVLHTGPAGVLHQTAAFLPALALVFALMLFGWAWRKLHLAKGRAEKELIKSEKLSSLGGLVAGVAHELNTPIGSAVTIASTVENKARNLQREIEQGPVNKSQLLEFINDMEYAGDIMLKGLSRANELLGHFKQVAVDQSAEQKRQFNLDNYIAEMSVTFKHLFKHRLVALELNLQSNAQMHSYPGSISQVIINLVQNALSHGFDKDEVGLIQISTRKSGNQSVEISVIDNGHGIETHHIDRIFDPFFTTKLGQGGSGLGLHIAHSIASNVLQGELQVVSDCDHRYTQFSLTIPCVIRDNKSHAMHEGTHHGQESAA